MKWREVVETGTKVSNINVFKETILRENLNIYWEYIL